MRLHFYTLLFFLFYAMHTQAQTNNAGAGRFLTHRSVEIKNNWQKQYEQYNSALKMLHEQNKLQLSKQNKLAAQNAGTNAILSNRHLHEYTHMLNSKLDFEKQIAEVISGNNLVTFPLNQNMRITKATNNNFKELGSQLLTANFKKSSGMSHQLDSVLVHSKEYNSETQEFTSSDYKVEYTYDQEHFNNLMTVKLCLDNNSYENYFKFEYTLHNLGYVNSQSYYEWVNNAWKGIDKEQVILDTEGYPTTTIWYGWDSINTRWIEVEKLEITFDSEHNPLMYLSSIWNADKATWEPIHKAEYSYTEGIGLTKSVFSNFDFANQAWAIYQFSEDLYNSKLQVTQRMMYTEYYGYKSEFDYDPYENLILSRDYNLDIETGNWNISSDVKFEYNANKKLLYFESKFYWDNYETPSSGERKVYTYNNEEQLLSETVWNWDPYEKLDYIPFRKEVISRNDSISSVVSYWGTNENDWLDNRMGIYNLNINKQIIRYTELYRNVYDSVWVNSSKTEYLLDDVGNILEESISYWAANNWINSDRTLYTYTAKKQISKLYKYAWSVDKREWLMIQKEETILDSADRTLFYLYFSYSEYGNYGYTSQMEYDSKGRTALYLNYAWDTENNEWKKVYHTEERYNADDQEIMRITLYWDFDGINYFYNGFKSENFYDEHKNMYKQVLSNFDTESLSWYTIADGVWLIDYSVSTENIYLPNQLYEASADYKVDEVIYKGKDPKTDLLIVVEQWKYFYTNLNTVSVEEISITEGLTVYPNPFSEHLYISSGSAFIHMQLCSLDGKVLKNIDTNNNELLVNTNELAPGIYVLKCTQANGNLMSRILIKK